MYTYAASENVQNGEQILSSKFQQQFSSCDKSLNPLDQSMAKEQSELQFSLCPVDEEQIIEPLEQSVVKGAVQISVLIASG